MAGQRRPGFFAAGLLVALAALFVLPWTAREVATAANRGRFVRTGFTVERYDRATEGSDYLVGRIEATGEEYRTDRTDLIETKPQDGTYVRLRADVWYLAPGGFWTAVDRVTPFRVQSVASFGQTPVAGIVAVNLALAGAAAWLLRRGAGLS